LNESDWITLGSDDELVRAIEEEKIRRIRSGAAKRELAQKHIVRGPDIPRMTALAPALGANVAMRCGVEATHAPGCAIAPASRVSRLAE
jgi:hypothetical protein